MPAKADIQNYLKILRFCFRGNDVKECYRRFANPSVLYVCDHQTPCAASLLNTDRILGRKIFYFLPIALIIMRV